MKLKPTQKTRIAQQLCSDITIADSLTRKASTPSGRRVAICVKHARLSTALAFHHGLFRITAAWHDHRQGDVSVIVLLPNGLYTRAQFGTLSPEAQNKVKGFVNSLLGKLRSAHVAA
jgi:hypothetical protein